MKGAKIPMQGAIIPAYIQGAKYLHKGLNTGVGGWNDPQGRMTPRSFYPKGEMTPLG